MKAFDGFRDSETFTAIPDKFFSELLGIIADVHELKVVLHAIWLAEHMDSPMRALASQDFAVATLALDAEGVQRGLAKAIPHGILLRSGRGNAVRYFLNSPRGRAAAKAMDDGKVPPPLTGLSAPLERTNVFKLYEENIGPLTPLIADALKDAETTFTGEWIVEAIELAAKNNKRSWSYCLAILNRWKEEGRGKKQNRRDDKAARQRDVEEKVRRFIRG